jgi:hypothetical protein
MVVTIGNYELLVKEEIDGSEHHHGCSGCFYEHEEDAVCRDVGDDIEPQLDASLFHPVFGGCGLRNSILIPNTPQDILTYLQEKLSND